MRARDVPIHERLLAKIDVQPSGCWYWRGVLHHGYGRIGFRGRRSVPAHRVAYEAWVGPIPKGQQLDHRCHTQECPGGDSCPHRRCVRPHPSHVWPRPRRANLSRKSNNKLTEEQRVEISRTTAPSSEVAAAYGVSAVYVRQLRNGTRERRMVEA